MEVAKSIFPRTVQTWKPIRSKKGKIWSIDEVDLSKMLSRLEFSQASHIMMSNKKFQEYYNYHFPSSFPSSFPSTDLENFAHKAWRLLKHCGYTFKFVRISDKEDSLLFSAIDELAIFDPNGKELSTIGMISFHDLLDTLVREIVYYSDTHPFHKTHEKAKTVYQCSQKFGI